MNEAAIVHWYFQLANVYTVPLYNYVSTNDSGLERP